MTARRWWPELYVEDTSPPGRDDPTDWIAKKEGEVFFLFDEFGDDPDSDAEHATIEVAVGGKVPFICCDDLPDVTVEVDGDDYGVLSGGAGIPPGPSYQFKAEDSDWEDSHYSLEDAVEAYRQANAVDDGEEIVFEVCRWSMPIPFQLIEQDGKARFVEMPLEAAQPAEPSDAVPPPITALRREHSPMKFTIDAALLAETLKRMAAVVERRNTIPILYNVRLRASTGGAAVAGTNLDIDLEEWLPGAAVEERGSTTCPLQPLLAIAERSAGETLSFSTPEAGVLEVRVGGAVFKMPALPVDDFPHQMPVSQNAVGFSLPASELLSALERIVFAMARDETRLYLRGVYMCLAENDLGADMLRLVATDGHRLGWRDLPLPSGAESLAGVIVMRETVTVLMANLPPDAVCMVMVDAERHKVEFAWGNVRLLSKTIDAQYPDYPRVIPKENARKFTVSRRLLQRELARVSGITREKSRAVTIAAASINGIIMSMKSGDDVSAEAMVGADMEFATGLEPFGVNANYLADVLQAAGTGDEDITFACNDPASPILATVPGAADAGFVLMPMRVS